jgi:hypothetical protein
LQSGRVGLELGGILTIIGVAFFIAGPDNLPTVPIDEVEEIGTTLLVIGIIIILISVIVLRKEVARDRRKAAANV